MRKHALLALAVILSPLSSAWGQTPVIFPANAPVTAQGNLTATAGANILNCKDLTGVRCVNPTNTPGWNGRTLDAWIAAAFNDIGGAGKVVVYPGSYTGVGSITVSSYQELHFEGNPSLTFALSATTPAFVLSPSAGNVSQSSISGMFTANLNNTGGTVFKLCGGSHFAVGPVDGVIRLFHITGNVMDVGPCTTNQSTDDFVVRNISVADGTVPGDFVQLICNNGGSSTAPYILNGRFENLTNDTAGGTTGIIGYAVRLKCNATGPQVNVNGIKFVNPGFQLKSSNTKAPVHLQSTFTSANSINMSFDGGYITLPSRGTQVIVDDDGTLNTATSIEGISFTDMIIFGGPNPTVLFSSHILSNAPTTSNLEFHLPALGRLFARPITVTASADPAATNGTINLGSTDTICWRNFAGTADISLGKDSSDAFTLTRLKTNQGISYGGADSAIVLSSGWGTGPAVSAAAGYDQALSFTVTSGTAPGANPVITITFKNGTWTTAPQYICSRNDSATPTSATFYPTWVPAPTTLTIAMQGTPNARTAYNFVCIAMGD